jgi:hypothetical protein
MHTAPDTASRQTRRNRSRAELRFLPASLARSAVVLAAAMAAVMATGATLAQPRPAPQPGAWEVAGRQGLMQFVIVPTALAKDREAYAQQLGLLCEPQLTCFINFFTNSTGAPVGVPLPDAIAAEPTAIFRRSTKQGAELLRWSCRLGLEEGNCF